MLLTTNVVQSVSVQVSAVDSRALAFNSNVTAGNFIVVVTATYHHTGTNGNVLQGGVTDGLSNSYTRQTGVQGVTDTAGWLTIHTAQSIIGGACTVTVNPNDTSADISIILVELSAIDTTSPYDTSNSQRNASAGTGVSPSLALTTSNEMVICGMTHVGAGQTISAPATGFTQIEENESVTAMPYNVGYKVITSPGSQAATWTLGGTAETLCGIIAIKAMPLQFNNYQHARADADLSVTERIR